jgi:hypothetical protein
MFTLEVEVALFLYFRQQVIQVKFHMRCSKWQVEMLYEFSDCVFITLRVYSCDVQMKVGELRCIFFELRYGSRLVWLGLVLE